MKIWIWVKTSFRGLHGWPECPHGEVEFLQNSHRHTFHVQLKLQVSHHDRENEFFMVQRELDHVIERLYNQDGFHIAELGRRSCEDIATEIHEEFVKGRKRAAQEGTTVGNVTESRQMVISVSEDGEVGAEVEFDEDDWRLVEWRV